MDNQRVLRGGATGRQDAGRQDAARQDFGRQDFSRQDAPPADVPGFAPPPPLEPARPPRLMSLATHVVYLSAYLAMGGLLAFALPYIRPESDPALGWLGGWVLALTGLVAHQAAARHDRDRYDRELTAYLRDHAMRSDVELTRLRQEIARLFAMLDGGRPGGVNYDTVMQEVKLLQSLVAKLQEKKTAAAPPAASEAEPPPRPAPTPRRAVDSGEPLLGRQAPAVAAPAGPPPGRLNDALVLDTVREALRADRIDIYLQPVVSLPQRKHRYYEVFSRVRASDGAQIMPDRYLEIAAREGLIATIDNLLLMRCIQLIRETERRQHHVGFFSNISAATLGDADFMKQFLNILSQNQTLVPKLVFELSQEELRLGGHATAGVLAQLARVGLRFSMDQVTDLNLDVDALIRADIRYLKIDCNLLQDRETRAQVEALRRRVQGHPVDIVVEKIETENQLIEILDMGIDFGQGYLFGEPRLSKKPA